MAPRDGLRRTLLGRPVAVAYGVLVALYLVRHARFQPLQIPAYLLIVAYDFVEVALPVLSPYHPVGFPVFLYALAVVAAAVARRLRPDASAGLGPAVGGAVLVVAALSFAFAVLVGGPLVSATDNPTPLAITATAGLVLAGVGVWLLRGRASEADPAA
ncbi:MAG: hypothetical protein U5J98_03430 [Halobacteriales archaeon]|nr:hypothetical protein [Halobacteriales archaeon]